MKFSRHNISIKGDIESRPLVNQKVYEMREHALPRIRDVFMTRQWHAHDAFVTSQRRMNYLGYPLSP